MWKMFTPFYQQLLSGQYSVHHKIPSPSPSTKYRYDPYYLKVKRFPTTQVKVENIDMLDKAIELLQQGENVILHNMCNPTTPGGNPEIVGAQEEDLFRRSNYSLTLTREFYPLKIFEAIYSPNVYCFRRGLRQRYEVMEKGYYLPMIACASLRNRGIPLLNFTTIMKLKMETLFQVAHKNGHEILILSAWGSGGFNLDPEHVSQLFREVIKEWDGCFKKIYFCIFDENFPKSNYASYKSCFE